MFAAVALNRSTWQFDWRQNTAKEVFEEWQFQLSRCGTREYQWARVWLTSGTLNWVCAVLESTYQWSLALLQDPYFCFCRFKLEFAVFVQMKKHIYATYLSTISSFLSYFFSAERAFRSVIFSIRNLVDTLHYLYPDWKSFSAESFGRKPYSLRYSWVSAVMASICFLTEPSNVLQFLAS